MVTHRAKPYQLALLIKKSLDDVIGTQQSVCEATLQYEYYNIHFYLCTKLLTTISYTRHWNKTLLYTTHEKRGDRL